MDLTVSEEKKCYTVIKQLRCKQTAGTKGQDGRNLTVQVLQWCWNNRQGIKGREGANS
jgi:hypothetical protein